MSEQSKKDMRKYLKGKNLLKAEKKIGTFYENNKEKIDKAFDPETMYKPEGYETFYMPKGDFTNKEMFTQEVLQRAKRKGISVDKAAKEMLRTVRYTSKDEIAKENLMKAMRKDNVAYKKWRKFTQHKKVNMENMVYMGDNTYQYTRDDGRIALMIIKDSYPINIIFRIL